MADKEPLLNLDTLVERPYVKINGTKYELRASGEMSLLDYYRVGKLGEKVEALFQKEEVTTLDELLPIAGVIDEMCRIVLFAPDEVHASLREVHKLQIIRAFTGLLRGEATPPAGETKAAPTESTGESTSPAS